jgi:hypothetical protein
MYNDNKNLQGNARTQQSSPRIINITVKKEDLQFINKNGVCVFHILERRYLDQFKNDYQIYNGPYRVAEAIAGGAITREVTPLRIIDIHLKFNELKVTNKSGFSKVHLIEVGSSGQFTITQGHHGYQKREWNSAGDSTQPAFVNNKPKSTLD